MFVRLAVVALALVGLGLAVRLYMSRSGEDRLRAGEAIDIRQLREPIPGNAFLACPPDYCQAMAAPSPIFSLPVARLVQLWTQMMTEPRIVIVTDQPQQHRLVIIQHTPLLRFPDIVTVEFVAIDDNRSSLAVYSRARYGSGDFGTNRRRVLAWLGRIEQLAHQ